MRTWHSKMKIHKRVYPKITLLLAVLLLVSAWPGVVSANTTYDTPAVTATAAGPYQIDIQWGAPSSIPEAIYGSVTGYEIFRCIPASPHLYQHLKTVSQSTYTYSDNTVTPGHSYMYSVWPTYSTQNQPNYNSVNSPVVTAPASPTGLPNPNIKINPVNDYSPLTPQITIDGAYSDHVNIGWAPFTGVSEQVYGPIEYYEVGRSTPDYPNIGLVLDHVAPSVYSYSDNIVVSGEQYLYSVRPMFSEEHNQPLLNIQGSSIVVIPNPPSGSGAGSSSGSNSESISATTSETKLTTTQEPTTQLIASTATTQPVTLNYISGPPIILNGQPLTFSDVQPEIKDGRTFVPVRSLAYGLGLADNNISWDGATNTVTISKGDLKISLSISSNQLIINGQVREMDTAPYMKNDRTIVPLRFIAEALGFTVGWDEENQRVIIKEQGS